MNKPELTGTISGKKIFVYDPGINCSEEDVSKYLADTNVLETLRSLVELAPKMFAPREEVIEKYGVPISEDLLIDAAYYIIKYSKSKNKTTLLEPGLFHLLKMCFKLNEAKLTSTKDAYEIGFKVGFSQFPFQERPLNLLARTIYIYNTLAKSGRS